MIVLKIKTVVVDESILLLMEIRNEYLLLRTILVPGQIRHQRYLLDSKFQKADNLQNSLSVKVILELFLLS